MRILLWRVSGTLPGPCHHVFPGRRRIAEVAGAHNLILWRSTMKKPALWLGLSLVLSYGVPPPPNPRPPRAG